MEPLEEYWDSAARAAHTELHSTRPSFIVIFVSSNDLWQIWQWKHSGVACQWANVVSTAFAVSIFSPPDKNLESEDTIDDFKGRERRCSSGAIYSPQVRHT